MNYIDYFVAEAERIYKRNKRRVQVLQVIGAIVIIGAIVLLKATYGEAKVAGHVQEEIADQIVRFHVLANSNSKEDQEVKLKVKNEVVAYMQGKLKDCNSKSESIEILNQEKESIRELAIQVLRENGYAYDVRCELQREYFPVKVYGDMTFPEGNYDAFRILIGNAEGKNWWCVMFPSLCLVNETYSVVPEESKDKLKQVLPEDDYEAIDTSKDTVKADASGDPIEEEKQAEIKYHFWIYDALSNWF
ncbi:MAG: stage II sporulation protein R [bacterium]|nr:stage II sporulation protein R [bacterium]